MARSHKEHRVGTHHGSLLDAVARLDDRVLLSRLAQEVRQLAVGALHRFTLHSVGAISALLLQGNRTIGRIRRCHEKGLHGNSGGGGTVYGGSAVNWEDCWTCFFFFFFNNSRLFLQ